MFLSEVVEQKTMHARYVPIPENVVEMLRPWREAKGKIIWYHDREEVAEILKEKKILKDWPQGHHAP